VVEDGSFCCVKPAERDGPEVDGPDVRGDLFESDVFTAEQVADVDPGRVPSDPAVGRDLADFEVGGIVGALERGRHGPRRGFVDGGWSPVVEGFVRPDLVEVCAELVEAPLLSGAVAGGWDGAVGLERLVHALVTAVLLRRGRLDEIGQDAELDPPHAEP
jgi:hypothetical protein